MTHEVVVEAGTQEALQGMLNELEPDDRKETEMLTRALAALEPDGWRGVDHGLRDEVRRDVRDVCAMRCVVMCDVTFRFSRVESHRITYRSDIVWKTLTSFSDSRRVDASL